MDVNEDEILISRRNMRNSDNNEEQHTMVENRHHPIAFRRPRNIKVSPSLSWLDLKVFYVKIKKCIVDNETTPEYLTLNHVPLNLNTLLEVNFVRTSEHSNYDETTFLKRDRLDNRSEEVTFVSTSSIRMTGSVRFEVYNKDKLVLSGVLEMCRCNNGYVGESNNQGSKWDIKFESDVFEDSGFLQGNRNWNQSPAIEVYVAGNFLGNPVILTKTSQLPNHMKRKQMRRGMLECIPEYDAPETVPWNDYLEYKQEDGYPDMKYLEGEDGELSWFNAGLRVGVGIGLSISIGVGIGVGLLVRTYHGTAKNFKKRLL